MDSGIIVYPRTLSTGSALSILLDKIDSSNFSIVDDISKVKSGEDLSRLKLYILASWGTTKEDLSCVLRWYPTLKLYRINEVNDILPLYVCQHDKDQLNTCLARYSHTKQLMCGSIPCNKIIDGFRVNSLDEFNKRNDGLYATLSINSHFIDIEHLHLTNVVNLAQFKQVLGNTYKRALQTLGKNEKMVVHLYGQNLQTLIDQINDLDHIYQEMWKRAMVI